jgi:hypothetical protein
MATMATVVPTTGTSVATTAALVPTVAAGVATKAMAMATMATVVATTSTGVATTAAVVPIAAAGVATLAAVVPTARTATPAMKMRVPVKGQPKTFREGATPCYRNDFSFAKSSSSPPLWGDGPCAGHGVRLADLYVTRKK